MKEQTDFKQLFTNTEKAYANAREAGKTLGGVIIEALRPLFPDLKVTLGGEFYSGMEAITLEIDDYEPQRPHLKHWPSLGDALNELLEPQNFYFMSDVILSPEEAEQVRKIISDLRKRQRRGKNGK